MYIKLIIQIVHYHGNDINICISQVIVPIVFDISEDTLSFFVELNQ